MRPGCVASSFSAGSATTASDLSPHLRSRHEVGRILRESGVPTIELRASIVIGSGSLSFELIRALSEHLPVMILPRWVSILAQPIAIGDLLQYLVQALDVPVSASVVVEIGGADRLSYAGLMREYMRQRSLRRIMIPVPVLTPWLSSLWLGLVTPLYARVGRKLIESIKHPTIVQDDAAARLFRVTPRSASEAIRSALAFEDREFAETSWYDARSAAGSPRARSETVFGQRLLDHREVYIDQPPERTFAIVEGIGGAAGWLAYSWLWRLRGFLDLLFGGVGMRRGRPMRRPLRVGDAVDFWRVEVYEPPRRLRLQAEMKLPGRAWLEFEVTPNDLGSTLSVTASFDPLGVLGRLYWFSVFPFHGLVFGGMTRAIAHRAAAAGRARPGPPDLLPSSSTSRTDA